MLRERRHIAPGSEDNFNVMDMQELVSTLTGTTKILTALLGAVAAVSLLVGGIGIMNIMLASITERVREIGIRKAIGATFFDVFTQILVESVVIAILGGLAGLFTSSMLVKLLIAMSPTENTPMITAESMMLAFGFSVAVGVLAGLCRQSACVIW